MVLVCLKLFFCFALAPKNNNPVTTIYSSLQLIICFLCEMPCNTTGTLSNTENVGFERVSVCKANFQLFWLPELTETGVTKASGM